MIPVHNLKRLLRYSMAHDIYTRIFRANNWAAMVSEMAFYKKVIDSAGDRGALIFDVGANWGDKSDVFRRIGAKVICFEPDQTCYQELQRRFKRRRGLTIVNAAVSNAVGSSTFYVHEKGSAYNTIEVAWKIELERSRGSSAHARGWNFKSSYEVKTTTLEQAIRTFGVPTYIKIDVEGHELQVLKGLSGNFKLLSFECNFPIFREQTVEAIRLLSMKYPSSRFNFTKGDLEFLFDEWQPYEAAVSHAETTTASYFEIFVRC